MDKGPRGLYNILSLISTNCFACRLSIKHAQKFIARQTWSINTFPPTQRPTDAILRHQNRNGSHRSSLLLCFMSSYSAIVTLCCSLTLGHPHTLLSWLHHSPISLESAHCSAGRLTICAALSRWSVERHLG